MHDLYLPIAQPASVYRDNTSATKIANNPVFHERTKHIEVNCHTIREKIQQGLIKLLLVRINHQLADILTKALPPGVFSQINSKLGSHNIYCPLAGGGVLEPHGASHEPHMPYLFCFSHLLLFPFLFCFIKGCSIPFFYVRYFTVS